jgi:hypothetical protein
MRANLILWLKDSYKAEIERFYAQSQLLVLSKWVKLNTHWERGRSHTKSGLTTPFILGRQGAGAAEKTA